METCQAIQAKQSFSRSRVPACEYSVGFVYFEHMRLSSSTGIINATSRELTHTSRAHRSQAREESDILESESNILASSVAKRENNDEHLQKRFIARKSKDDRYFVRDSLDSLVDASDDSHATGRSKPDLLGLASTHGQGSINGSIWSSIPARRSSKAVGKQTQIKPLSRGKNLFGVLAENMPGEEPAIAEVLEYSRQHAEVDFDRQTLLAKEMSLRTDGDGMTYEQRLLVAGESFGQRRTTASLSSPRTPTRTLEVNVSTIQESRISQQSRETEKTSPNIKIERVKRRVSEFVSSQSRFSDKAILKSIEKESDDEVCFARLSAGNLA